MAASPTKDSWCVLEFVAVQHVFRRQSGHRGPPEMSIRRWYEQFRYRGCICHQGKGRAGRPSVTEEMVDRVRETFTYSPRKSVRRASRQLKIPEPIVRKILRKWLQFYRYKLQLVQNTPIIYTHPVYISIKYDININVVAFGLLLVKGKGKAVPYRPELA
jgi:hypothetical protein